MVNSLRNKIFDLQKYYSLETRHKKIISFGVVIVFKQTECKAVFPVFFDFNSSSPLLIKLGWISNDLICIN